VPMLTLRTALLSIGEAATEGRNSMSHDLSCAPQRRHSDYRKDI